MEQRAPCKRIFCPYTHPQPLERGQRSKHFFLNVVMLHIKLKGMEHRAPYEPIFRPYTHPQPKVKMSECGHVAYQIKEKKEV